MAKRLLRSLILTSKSRKPFMEYGTMCTHTRTLNTSDISKEVKIPVQWGHISAKLWGNEHEQPILALHGWQDNAGTWDTLAPMLYEKRPILAIDFPGHGLSSWFPPGVMYYPWEFARLILVIKEHYKWDKISLLCHSMGSIAGLRFAALFPDEVDFYVALDNLIADDYDLNQLVDKYPKKLRKLQLAESRLEDEPPSYSLEAITKTWYLGTSKSVALESVKYLLKRGMKMSRSDPNKYYFSRDPRLKHVLFTPENKKFVEILVKRLTCPILYIKALDSPFQPNEFSLKIQELIQENNPKFDCHVVPGTHHVHLNEPDKIANLILEFYQKHNLVN